MPCDPEALRRIVARIDARIEEECRPSMIADAMKELGETDHEWWLKGTAATRKRILPLLRDARDLLSALSERALSPEAGRTFWVVERWQDNRSVGYWDGANSRSFITDINGAVQFCRKQDAFWATRGWHWSDTKICEHMYVPLPTPPQGERHG